MTYKILALVAICSIATLSSCKSRKKIADVTSPPITEANVSPYWAAQYTGQYLEARGKATVTMDGKTNNVALHLKMRKDSIIWGKFSMFGMGITVLITKDSFFMINPLAQEYMAYDNDYLNQYLGFKADLSHVQNLLVGNAIFEPKIYRYMTDDKQLKGSEGIATNMLTINDENRTHNSKIITPDSTQNAHIQYSMYSSLDSQLLPTIVNILVKKQAKNMSVVLNYQTLSSAKIATFPFKIPNGYTKK